MAKRKRRTFTPEFKQKLCLRPSAVKAPKPELYRRYNLSEEQLSTWKRQLLENAASLFESRDKLSKETTERIAQLEQLVSRLTVAVDIHERASMWLSETGLKNEK